MTAIRGRHAPRSAQVLNQYGGRRALRPAGALHSIGRSGQAQHLIKSRGLPETQLPGNTVYLSDSGCTQKLSPARAKATTSMSKESFLLRSLKALEIAPPIGDPRDIKSCPMSHSL